MGEQTLLDMGAQREPLRFHVPGSVKGWQRAGVRVVKNKAGHHFASHYTPAKTRHFEAKVGDYAMQAKGLARWEMTDQPVKMAIEAVFAIPESWSNKKRFAHIAAPYTGKPDSDNIYKAVADALNQIVYVDDKQIWALQVIKRYAKVGEGEGMYITVTL